MNTLFRLIPAIVLCTALTACGDRNDTTTTTTTDTAVLTNTPTEMAPPADNTGTGIEGSATNPEASGTTRGANGSTGTMNSNNGSGNNTNSGTNTGVVGPDRTNGRNNPGTRITAEDSVNNRTGLAPVK